MRGSLGLRDLKIMQIFQSTEMEELTNDLERRLNLLRTEGLDLEALGWSLPPNPKYDPECRVEKLLILHNDQLRGTAGGTFRFMGSVCRRLGAWLTVSILYDSGARGNFMTREIYAKLAGECELIPVYPPIIVSSIHNRTAVEYKTRVQIRLGGYCEWFECYLLPNLNGEQVILGREALASHEERIENGKRYIGRSGEPLYDVPDENLDRLLHVLYEHVREDPFGRMDEIQPALIEKEPGEDLVGKNATAFAKMMQSIEYPEVRRLVQGFEELFTERLTYVPESRGEDDCSIDILNNQLLVLVKPYKLSPVETATARQSIQQLLEADIIEEGSDHFLAPILFVPKGKDGVRMCIDFRRVNMEVALHQGEIPRIEELLREVTGHKFITALDLTSAFHQQRIEPTSRAVTTFRFEEKAYQFKLLPFGLKVSPLIMQQAVRKLFAGIANVRNYIDDIVVFSDTLEEHVNTLGQVLNRCREKTFYLKASKCEFARELVQFLGYQVLAKGISIPQDRMDAFRELKCPKTKKGMQQALGVFNYFREFVPEYAYLAHPLHAFATGPERAKFTSEIKRAFHELVGALIRENHLYPILDDAPFWLETDASGYAVAAVLFQWVNGEKYGPVAVMSKTLGPHEQMYPIRQKELFAMVLALQRWRIWVIGRPITAYTDHQSLTSLIVTLKQPEVQRVAGWVERLLEFDLLVKYINGTQNAFADFLSRQIEPHIQELYRAGIEARLNHILTTGLTETVFLSDFTERLLEEYEKDTLSRTRLQLWRTTPPEHRKSPLFQAEMGQCEVINGILVKGNVPWVPPALAKEIITQLHERAHLGDTKLWHMILGKWTTGFLFSLIRKVIANCFVCQKKKIFKLPTLPLYTPKVPSQAFERIHIDYLMGLPRTLLGFDAILTVVDAFSKFAIFIATRHTASARTTVDLLITHVFVPFGHPKVIVSDQGSSVLQGAMRLLRAWIGASARVTTPNHPQSNGQAERANQTITQMLRCLTTLLAPTWPSVLSVAQIEYNRAWCRAIRMSPFEAVFAREPPLFVELGRLDESKQGLPQLINMQRVVRQIVHENLSQSQMEMEVEHNRAKKAKDITFELGDLVLVSKDYFAPQPQWKMVDCYFGPYSIVHPIDDENYKKYFVRFDHALPLSVRGGRGLVREVNAQFIRRFLRNDARDFLPTDKEGFLDTWRQVIAIRSVRTDFSVIGLAMEQLETMQVAQCEREWFLEFPQSFRKLLVMAFVEQPEIAEDEEFSRRAIEVLVEAKAP